MESLKNYKHVVVKNNVNPEFIDQFLILAELLVMQVRQEPGNIHFYLIKSMKSEFTYLFVGTWVDQEAFQAHMTSEHFSNSVPQIGECILELETNKCDNVF
ncbi:MAG: putative quinol monooxygenase [Brevinema sp.]